LRCRIVAGGANNQLAHPEDAGRLRARGILYAPDYVVNVGGAMAIPGIETLGWSQAYAEEKVIKSVRYALQRIFEMANAEGITTDEAAHRIAKQRFSKEV
jgi:glutamate dehydrogenase/leucine dehydrogenase